jgi:hypothetical protein
VYNPVGNVKGVLRIKPGRIHHRRTPVEKPGILARLTPSPPPVQGITLLAWTRPLADYSAQVFPQVVIKRVDFKPLKKIIYFQESPVDVLV